MIDTVKSPPLPRKKNKKQKTKNKNKHLKAFEKDAQRVLHALLMRRALKLNLISLLPGFDFSYFRLNQ